MTSEASPVYRAELYQDSNETMLYGEIYPQRNRLLACCLYQNPKGSELASVGISSQFGCPVRCRFCNVPEFQQNVSEQQAVDQVRFLIHEAHEHNVYPRGIRHLKISMVKAGDAALNPNLVPIVESLIEEFRDTYGLPTIKVSTTFPNCETARDNLSRLTDSAHNYAQEGGILYPMISLHATNDSDRQATSRIDLSPIACVRSFGEQWYDRVGSINGRKALLAFTLNEESVRSCNAADITEELPPGLFAIAVRDEQSIEGSGLSQETFTKVRGDFISQGYEFIDELATPLEVAHGTEVGLWQTLSQTPNSSLSNYPLQS